MSSWKARLLMALTILTMLLAMSAAPAMAHDFNGFGFPDHRSGFLGDFRDDCDHNFRFCDDGGGIDAFSVGGADCIEVVDDDGDVKRVICFDEFGRVILNQRV